MKFGCPMCGATSEIEEAPTPIKNGQYTLAVRSEGKILNDRGATVHMYVCPKCGFIALRSDPSFKISTH